MDISLGAKLGQCRAVPVELGLQQGSAVLLVHSADATVDPYSEMFFFPTDTLKLTLVNLRGTILWQRDLERGVVPGTWFCPVFPFDLDGDGVDEIYLVGNPDADHPLSHNKRRLERIDSLTGQTTGHWPWPTKNSGEKLSYAHRNFILGGHVKGQPVLVTAQGTYQNMHLQAWQPDMTSRWQVDIAQSDPGARGSHMCPITDLDGDGAEEVMWGERCIALDDGAERFCADRSLYRGHSDVIQPFRDPQSDRWFLFTLRESDPQVSPRIAVFDAQGARVWGELDRGHMDMGWVARLGPQGETIASAIRIGSKTAGPGGFSRSGVEEFTYNASTGKPVALPFATFETVPVDINGDVLHELIRTTPEGRTEVINRQGEVLGDLGPQARVALACKILPRPGEQILTYTPEGRVCVWCDSGARDTPAAQARYSHPLYRANRRLMATGANRCVLGGIY